MASELRSAYESQAGERETNTRYGKASVERDKAVALDSGQGFAPAWRPWRSPGARAEAARQGRAWGQALSGYDKVLAECRNLQALATARQQAADGAARPARHGRTLPLAMPPRRGRAF